MRNAYVFLPVLVIISIVIGVYGGYLMALSKIPITKDIEIPEIPDNQSMKLVNQARYEHYRVGNISYLTTGPSFSQFVYSCYPSVGSAPGGPSCLALAYDGKPGIVELKIPKYLIEEFPRIDEVHYDGPFFLDESFPFQVIEENSSFVTLRIQIPSNHTVVSISVSEEGSLSPFSRDWVGWGVIFSAPILILGLVLLIKINIKLGYFMNK